jgi:type II secretory pathway component PulC
VIIDKVDINSQGYIDGFNRGDIIIQIGNYKVESIKDIINILKLYKGRKKRVYINRKGNILFIVK